MRFRLAALPVACALALGCATARAQEEPPPGGQPPAAGPETRRPPADAARVSELDERIAKAEASARDAQARLDQLTQVEKRPQDDADVRQATKAAQMWENHLKSLRAERESILANGGRFRGPGGPNARGPRGPMHGGGPGPGPGPGPLRPDGPPGSVEERLARLERAVHELHALFERHGVPREMREVAERRLREMHGGPPPGGGPGPRRGPRGGPPPLPGEAEAGPPAPPPPPRMPRFDMDDTEEARLRVAVRQGEIRAALESSRRELDGMRSELQRAREELERAKDELAKTQAEVERLRGGK